MFEVIALEGCPHSQRAVELMKNLGTKHNVIWVPRDSKEKFKTPNRPTFPQISFHVRRSKGPRVIYIGGCDDLENLISTCKNLRTKYDPTIAVPLMMLLNKV